MHSIGRSHHLRHTFPTCATSTAGTGAAVCKRRLQARATFPYPSYTLAPMTSAHPYDRIHHTLLHMNPVMQQSIDPVPAHRNHDHPSSMSISAPSPAASASTEYFTSPSSKYSSAMTAVSSSSQEAYRDRETHKWHVHDNQGLIVTLSDTLNEGQVKECVAYINEYMHQVFTYGDVWNVILRASEYDPFSVLINVFIADYYIARQDASLAQERLNNARTHVDECTERERLWLGAMTEWLNGHVALAIETFEVLLFKYPDDLFAAKKAQLLAFLMSDKYKMLDLMQQPHTQKIWEKRRYYHAMLSFALEQNGDERGAEETARIGLASNAVDDVWSQHALAHVLYSTGRNREGIDVLMKYRHTWEYRMSFMYTHAYFHLCLYLLDLCRYDELQHMFDEHVWNKNQQQNGNGNGNAAVRTNTGNNRPIKHGDAGRDDRNHNVNVKFAYDFKWVQQDKTYIEDQFSALDLLWKWQCRSLIHDIATSNVSIDDRHALQRISRNEDGTRRRDAGLVERTNDVMKYIKFPVKLPLNLFGLFVLNSLCYVNRQSDAEHLLDQMYSEVESVSEDRKKRLEMALLPFADALYISYQPHQLVQNKTHALQHSNVADDAGSDESIAFALERAMNHEDEPARHRCLEVLGGSAEQREVVEDFYVLTLLEAAVDGDRYALKILTKYLTNIVGIREESIHSQTALQFVNKLNSKSKLNDNPSN
jgi:hypothetical protein